jgi:hypothetical protein
MPDISNTFITGIMNKDLDDRLVPNGTFRDALNIDVDTSSSSNVGMAQNVMGNVLTVDLATISGQSVVDARTIGAITHESTGLIYWFVASDFFDGIYEYNSQTGDVFRVLQSNKVNEGTPSQLNFRKEYAITGVNYILGDNTDNYLFWTDDYNPPRRVTITRVKDWNVNDYRIDMDINVILAPPLYAPSIEPFIDTDGPNVQASNMSEKFMYFAYRYKYIDGQYSSLSPFSAVAFGPKDFYYDYGIGNNRSMTNKYNSVRVSFETGNEFVESIQLVVRDTKSINVSIIDTYPKSLMSIPDDYSYRIVFTNNKLYAALPQEQVTRLFDNVPLLAKAQDVVGNRIAYGNYVQFQNITDCNGDDINVNFSLSLTSTEATLESPKPTWRSDRDYEFGIVYLDDYGRMTTVLASQNNSINVPPVNAISANIISLRLSSSPPCWATHYRIVVKQPKKSYYNVFPILFYENGLFRYFRIHESDKDKIRVGEYIVFKSVADGATMTNKKYKILEIESKTADFIGGNSFTETEGLYFKIKVDVSSELSTANLSVFFNEVQTNNGFQNNAFSSSPGFLFPQSYPIVTQEISIPSVQLGAQLGGIGALDKAIHYGLGNKNAITSGGTSQGVVYRGSVDRRITIEIVTPTTFRWTQDIKAVNGWIGPINIPNGAYGFFQDPNNPSIHLFYATFNNSYDFIQGDRWKINCRTASLQSSSATFDQVNNPYINLFGASNYFGGLGIPYTAGPFVMGGYAASGYGGGCVVTTNEIGTQNIYPGSVIRINIIQDSLNPSTQDGVQEFISPSFYENLEEWFVESGAWQEFVQYDDYGNNINADGVTFRRGYLNQGDSNIMPTQNFITQPINGSDLSLTTESAPIHMIIRGYGSDPTLLNSQGIVNFNENTVKCSIEIIQSSKKVLCETVATETDIDIYHELFQTYPIKDNKHVVLWDYDDYQYVSGGQFNGYTILTQLDSERPKKRPHYFNVGDLVDVNSSALPMPDGTYTVLAVNDLYSIIIDLGFPGAGAITPGTVKFNGSLEQDQGDTFAPAVIEINKPQSFNTEFSAWCWGNGLESDRIYDDFNQTEKDFSVRVTTPVEDYKQVRSEASICYSGIFKQGSGINRLNEFNLSLSNFKYLDRDFGSIQKLYARNTDIVVFQQNKVSNVLYEKNVLFDSVGGGQVVSIPEVLGTQIPMIGEYGISNNPESFDNWGQLVFFTDARRGLVLQMENDLITEISDWGMNDFFRDIMRENPYTQKLGCYDPYLHKYVLAFNDQKVFPCKLTLSRDSYKGPSNPFGVMAFSISTDTSWTISVQNEGYGTSWVSNYATSGFGSQNIFINVARNNTGFNRFVTFVVSYCDGLTQEFVLNQAKGKRGDVVVTIFNKPKIIVKG